MRELAGNDRVISIDLSVYICYNSISSAFRRGGKFEITGGILNDTLSAQKVVEDLQRWIGGVGVIALAAQVEGTATIAAVAAGNANLARPQLERLMLMHEIMSAVVERHGIVAARNWFLSGRVGGLGHNTGPRDAIRDGHFSQVKSSAKRFINTRTPHPLEQ